MTVSECAKLLGEAIAKDEAVVAFETAKKAYEEHEELQKALREYGAQRMILGQEFTKDTAMQDGELIAELSRAEAQRRALEALLTSTRPGDLLPARVTHLEPFGAFLDVGCGVASLLSVDCISVSRIAHPRDRLTPGMELTVAVKSIERDTGRIYVTLRELLGTWEENAAAFEAGQTVRGIVRSVEDYGIFVELAPNLAGLAELRPADADAIRRSIGHTAAVYIKSIVPERMKIKLVLIDVAAENAPVQPLRYFLSAQSTPHLSHWVYSPPASRRVVETLFDA